ncbi:MAG: hypothetical protein WA152_03320 [Microgenomates group bacterium]
MGAEMAVTTHTTIWTIGINIAGITTIIAWAGFTDTINIVTDKTTAVAINI